MKFGRTTEESLDSIDFALREDHPDNSVVLEASDAENCEIFIGCSRWGRQDWVGKLYPRGAKPAEFLRYYAQAFNSIELNPTHYRIPETHIVQRWTGMVPDGFLFCPKVYQGISHFARLKNQEAVTERFCDAIRHFGEHLGLVFLQLHPSFTPGNYDLLEAYLSQWPKDISLSLELRHADWFERANIADRLFHLMREKNVASVITDTGLFRNLVHMRLSSPEVLIRFVGNSLHPTDYQRIDNWIDRLGTWMQQGIRRIWFFVHQHEELHSPELIRYMAIEMNKKLGTQVKIPRLLTKEDQPTLF